MKLPLPCVWLIVCSYRNSSSVNKLKWLADIIMIRSIGQRPLRHDGSCLKVVVNPFIMSWYWTCCTVIMVIVHSVVFIFPVILHLRNYAFLYVLFFNIVKLFSSHWMNRCCLIHKLAINIVIKNVLSEWLSKYIFKNSYM